MSAQAPTLDYAGPQTRLLAPPGQKWLVFALAVAVAFLGANAFADAAGFPPIRDAGRDAHLVVLRILCGLVLFLVALVGIAALLRAGGSVIDALARTPDRPGPAVAMAALICGTICILATLVIQGFALRYVSPFAAFVNEVGAAGHTPLMLHLATIFTFLAGAALVAIGVWSSLGRGGAGGGTRP